MRFSRGRFTLGTALLVCLSVVSASGRLSKTAVVDKECDAIRSEFVEQEPEYFSGPEPWTRIDALPKLFSDFAVATVYGDGSRVKWLVLDMPGDGWYERTHYFFDEAGAVKKRERELEHRTANVRVTEWEYFREGKKFKTEYHHSPLFGDREDWDLFHDPKAPAYTSIEDLPALFSNTVWKKMASLEQDSGLCTQCTRAVTIRPESLLKFSRPVLFAG